MTKRGVNHTVLVYCEKLCKSQKRVLQKEGFAYDDNPYLLKMRLKRRSKKNRRAE